MLKTGLILALDLLNKHKAIEVVNATSEYIDMIKINYPLVLSAGIEIIEELSAIKPVIADFKVADIPYTSSIIAEIAFKSKAKAIICHGFVGSDTIEAILNIAKKFDGEVYVVAELSSKGGEEFMSKHSKEIARMAKDLGCHGIIAPATRLDRVIELRKVVGNLKILSPGVGIQGGSIEVAKYVDYIIVGRSIYNSTNPEKAAREIFERLHEI